MFQKRLTRPISKLLNPFLEGSGYNVAVGLTFTQTKCEMPKTKQSSISSFFTPQRRGMLPQCCQNCSVLVDDAAVDLFKYINLGCTSALYLSIMLSYAFLQTVLNKISASEVPNMGPAMPMSPVSTTRTSVTPSPVTSGTKRRREMDPDLCNSDSGVDLEWESENVPACEEQTASHTPSQNINCEEHFEEISPPQSKRRLTATSSLQSDGQPQLSAWSQDPLFTCSPYSEGESCLSNQKSTTADDFIDSEPSFLSSLQSEDVFGLHVGMKATTSTQKPMKHIHSSLGEDEKENSLFLCSHSPHKNSVLSHTERLSNHKWMDPKTLSPNKHSPVSLLEKAGEEDSHDSEFKWAKLRSSSTQKTHPHSVVEEDSLAMLFTQDSEGFRVIAHRGLQGRSPLKDQSNISTGMIRARTYKCLVEEDEEDKMLFTQDSQGNLVIKH